MAALWVKGIQTSDAACSLSCVPDEHRLPLHHPRIWPQDSCNHPAPPWYQACHSEGELLDQSKLATTMGNSGQTVGRYIDLLCDFMLVRRLPAWSGNVGKRLIR